MIVFVPPFLLLEDLNAFNLILSHLNWTRAWTLFSSSSQSRAHARKFSCTNRRERSRNQKIRALSPCTSPNFSQKEKASSTKPSQAFSSESQVGFSNEALLSSFTSKSLSRLPNSSSASPSDSASLARRNPTKLSFLPQNFLARQSRPICFLLMFPSLENNQTYS